MSRKSNRTGKSDKNDINNLLSKLKVVDTTSQAIIYARCSTAKQNEDNHQSLQTQIGMCIAYADINNLTIVDTIQEVVRGHNSDKQSYLSITEKYRNTNIIIADASRLSRNINNANDFLTACENSNIIIHSVRDDITTHSNQEKKKFINCVFDASIESKTIGKRVSSAFKIRKQLGGHFGKAPYGYTKYNHVDKKSGIKLRKLKEEPKEQLAIQLICKLFYGGTALDIYKIVKKINPTIDFKLHWANYNDGDFIVVYYGNLIIKDIVILLNNNLIDRRNEMWRYRDVSEIVRKYHHNDIIC